MDTVIELLVCCVCQRQCGAGGGGTTAVSRGQPAPPVSVSVSSYPDRQVHVAGELLQQEPQLTHVQVSLLTCPTVSPLSFLSVCQLPVRTLILRIIKCRKLCVNQSVFLIKLCLCFLFEGVLRILSVTRFSGLSAPAAEASAVFRWRHLTPGQ